MLIQTKAQIRETFERIRETDPLALDSESTGLHPYEGDRLTGISVAGPDWEAYFPFRHRTPLGEHATLANGAFPEGWNLTKGVLADLMALLSEPGRILVWWNALFDWPIFEIDGWKNPGWEYSWDGKVVSWLVDENVSHALKDQADRWLHPMSSAEMGDLKDLLRKRPGQPSRTWGDLTPAEVGEYGAKDARLTYDMWAIQSKLVSQHADLGVAVAQKHRELAVLHEMQATGVAVDLRAVQEGHKARLGAIERIQAQFPDTNLNAPHQLASLLYDEKGYPCERATKKKGARSTDKQALEKLLALPEARETVLQILEYRQASKAASAYFGAIQEHLGLDGRVHPAYNSTSLAKFGTATGRLSSSSPNLQTIPKEEVLPDVRAVFTAPDGCSLWEYDLQQAEMRVAADYAQDERMLHDLETDDLHAATADRVFGRHDGLYRRMAKNLNFGFLYGIGPATFVATAARGGVDLTVGQAAAYLNKYAQTYPNLRRAADAAQAVAQERGFVKLWPVGRRRLYRSPGLEWPRYYTAFNALCQGGVAEVMLHAMCELGAPLAQIGARMVLQVHDSLLLEVPIGQEDVCAQIVRQTFERVNPFTVPLPVDAHPWHPDESISPGPAPQASIATP